MTCAYSWLVLTHFYFFLSLNHWANVYFMLNLSFHWKCECFPRLPISNSSLWPILPLIYFFSRAMLIGISWNLWPWFSICFSNFLLCKEDYQRVGHIHGGEYLKLQSLFEFLLCAELEELFISKGKPVLSVNEQISNGHWEWWSRIRVKIHLDSWQNFSYVLNISEYVRIYEIY